MCWYGRNRLPQLKVFILFFFMKDMRRVSYLLPIGISVFGFILLNSHHGVSNLGLSNPPIWDLYPIVYASMFAIAAMIVSLYFYYSNKDRKIILVSFPFILAPIILRLYFMIVIWSHYPTTVFEFL